MPSAKRCRPRFPRLIPHAAKAPAVSCAPVPRPSSMRVLTYELKHTALAAYTAAFRTAGPHPTPPPPLA
jgi:hypothetical protein